MRTACRPAIVLLFTLAALPAMAVDGATPIPFTDPYATPVNIANAGSYVVTRNLLPSPAGTPIITVDCNAMAAIGPPSPVVYLDLNGFVLDNSASAAPVIEIMGHITCEVIIRNGDLIGGTEGISVVPDTRLRKIVVEDVEVKETEGAALALRDVEEFALRRNTVVETSAGPCIELSGPLGVSKSGVIEGNLLRRCVDGIVARFLVSVEISNNRIEEVATGPAGGGIILAESRACLIAQNTINDVSFGGPGVWNGIRLENTSGCKLYNNLINRTGNEGILLNDGCEGNLIEDNVVRFSGDDGIYVNGKRNRIRGNLLVSSGTDGTGHGLHLGPGAFDNQYGGNTAEGHPGGPCPIAGAWSPDFCDENAPGFPNLGPNWSFINSLMPGGFGPV